MGRPSDSLASERAGGVLSFWYGNRDGDFAGNCLFNIKVGQGSVLGKPKDYILKSFAY